MEALPEHRTDSGADADLPGVALLTENLIEVEDTPQRDAEFPLDLPTIVLQSEPDLQHPFGLEQVGDEFPALLQMDLEDERFVPEGELNDVGASAFLTDTESGFRFRIEPSETRLLNLSTSLDDGLRRLRDVDALQRKPLERFQQGGLSF